MQPHYECVNGDTRDRRKPAQRLLARMQARRLRYEGDADTSDRKEMRAQARSVDVIDWAWPSPEPT
jgi:hypothetical protein